MAREILEGIRVLDMTMYQFGPVATMMLAAMGAEVIKIERPTGEPGRGVGRGAGGGPRRRVVKGGEGKGFGGSDLSSYFETNNRCKKSLVLDLNKPKAREVLYQLVAKSDVFVQNMRTGVAAKLGCDYETLKQYNPELIYCSGCSFGTKGPDGRKPGMDLSGCARSGWMYRVPLESGEPVWALPGSSDQVGAIFISHAVVAALLARERFGIGQEIETSHLTASMWVMGCSLQMMLYMKAPLPVTPRERSSTPLFNYYKCADGEWLALVCPTARHWVPICEAMGIPESVYKGDPHSNTDVARFNSSRETVALLDNAFVKKTRDEWIKAFEGKDIFWEKIQKIEDLPNDPQVIANEYLTDYTHPLTGETYKYQNLPMQFKGTPAMRQGRAPLLGEHTEEILVDILGYKKEDMPKLLDEIGRP
jgi:crotonobetainyl-CoA:carnitine CoA-transferase CaiB-like acyl-CoA transferase